MRLGLRTKLLGVTVALLAALTVGALGEVYYSVGQQVREQAARKLRAGAHVLTSILLRTEEQLVGRADVLLQLPSLRAALTERRQDLEPLLQEIKAMRTANLLWATDAQGHVLASTGEYPPLGVPLAHHPLIARALQGERALGFDRFTEAWWLLLSLPVAQAEEFSTTIGTVTLGLLIGEAYLNRLAEVIGTDVGFLWNTQHFWSNGWPPGSHGALAGHAADAPTGTPHELSLGPSGRVLWMKQSVTLGVSPGSERPTALLGARLDEAVILQMARAIGWIAVGVMVFGALILTGAIRSITRPLKSLVADSHRVGSGDLTHRAHVYGADEVAELATAFNQMVENLWRSQEALVQAKRDTENIIRRMINSLVVTDAQGVIRSANPATMELLGYAEAELIGQPVQRLFTGEACPFTGEGWRAFLERGVIRNVESTYRSKHEKQVPVLVSGVVLREDDGAIQGVVCVAQDMTERKYLEQLKDQFLSTVSHELRTPLTMIRESILLALDGTLGPVNAEQGKFLRVARTETRRLERLINSLLDLSAIESGTLALQRQPLDVAALLDQAWKHQEATVEQRTLIRRLGRLPAIMGDSRRIQQVLEHLLSNAIQFTKPDGTITVSAEPRDGAVAVAVADDGAGIPPEEARKLFQKFVQLGRAEQERSGGAGVGLILCRRLVELHRGSISVASEPGKGATFTFTLPV